MKHHPLSEMFPMLAGDELQALADDIKANGLKEPVVSYEGMILDGRNRWEACKLAGIKKVPTAKYEGDDPAGYVVSVKLYRRHLTTGQRAMIANRIANMPRGGDRKSDQTAKMQFDSVADAAATLNVGERTVHQARTVQEKGTKEEVAAVDRGEVPVGRAEKIIREKEKDIRDAAKADPDRFGDLAAKLDEKGAKVDPIHRELKKREKAGTRKKDVLKDATGYDVPDGLRDLFGDWWLIDTATALEQIARDTLKAVLARVQKKGPAYKFLLCSDILKSLAAAKTEIETAHAHLTEGRPHAVHRACEGKGCKDCRQAGWVPRWRLKELAEGGA